MACESKRDATLNVLLMSYSRSQQSLDTHGANSNVAMKPDGSVLLISTTMGFLLYLKVNYDKPKATSDQVCVTKEHGIMIPGTYDVEVAGEGTCADVITVKLCHESYVAGNIVSLLCVGNQLVICTQNGHLHRIGWDGRIEKSSVFTLFEVPVANDMLPESRGQPLGSSSLLRCVSAVYSVELQGFAVVLSDGRAVFVTWNSAKLDTQPLQGVWIKELNDAVCVTINPKYRLISFGRQNGAVNIYGMDDSNGLYTWSLLQTFQLTKRQFPETGVQLGPVQSMDWSVGDGMVLAVSWRNGGLSIWSVFGSLLMCSLGDQPGTPSPLNPHCIVLQSVCWSADGYHLWMLPEDHSGPSGERSGEEGFSVAAGNSGDCVGGGPEGGIMVMRFVKNSIVSNPIIANHQHILLQGVDRLLLNMAEGVVCAPVPSGSAESQQSGGMYMSASEMTSSPQWRVIQLPLSYLILNWPVKYVAMDSTATNIAIAGKCGFALYSGTRRKWKLFGNELQEQSVFCRGGLAWYQEVVVFPCQVQDGSDEIQFYSLQSNLDFSQLLLSLKLASPVVSLNLHDNYLVLASRDCHVIIYELRLNSTAQGESLSAALVFETSLVNFLSYPWAGTLVSIVPSNVCAEPVGPVVSGKNEKCKGTLSSVFINISGKLLMMQQDQSHYPYKMTAQDHASTTLDTHSWSFGAPVIVTSGVEAVWSPVHTSVSAAEVQQEDYLMESLWLSCGAGGVKVWLPLYPHSMEHLSFLSKRVMLTLPLDMYPQAVLFQDAILFGLSHETAGTDPSNSHSFPYATVERSTHIFLHHILRLLLRRNLGSHAFQIARSCLHLPYFYHVLELMLHEVLEEEAPRAMPMTVVEFIKQFPQFLETVGSCARKTEVALWQYLFAAVGNPRDLFELCLSDGRMKTAACYLIIIQNLESSSVSRQLATRLLDAALDSNEWEVVVDLVRFLRAIGPGDSLESPAHLATPSPGNITPKLPKSRGSFTSHLGRGTSPFTSPPDLDRSARDHLAGGPLSISGNYKDASGRVIKRPQFVADMDTKEEYFIEMILSRHARKLLLARCMRDLGKFVAHLNFDLQGWMARERSRAAKIENFITTLSDLHKQFQWPFPAVSTNEISRIGGRSSSNFLPVTSSGSTRSTTSKNLSSALSHDSDALISSIKRATRPPDLDLSPSNQVVVTAKSDFYQRIKNTENSVVSKQHSQFDPSQSSTPTKLSDSVVSEGISLVSKNNMSSMDMHVEQGSVGDALDETEWDVAADDAIVAIQTVAPPKKLLLRTESEIRYFVKVAQEALCLDWAVLLGVLLLDEAVVRQAVQWAGEKMELLTVGGVAKVVQEMEDLSSWASQECPGYQPFLESIDVHMNTLKSLQRSGTVTADSEAVNQEHTTPVASMTSTNSTIAPGTVTTTSSITTGHPDITLAEDTDSHVETIKEEDSGSGCSVS